MQQPARPILAATRTFCNSAVVSEKKLSRVPLTGRPKGSEPEHGIETSNSIEFSTGKAIALFLVVGGVSYYVFTNEKKKLEARKEAEANRGYGKPSLGVLSHLSTRKVKSFLRRICMASSASSISGSAIAPIFVPTN